MSYRVHFSLSNQNQVLHLIVFLKKYINHITEVKWMANAVSCSLKLHE